MRQFIVRLCGMALLLGSVLMLETLLMGDFSPWALPLMVVFGLLAARLLAAGAHTRRKRRRTRTPAPHSPARQARRTSAASPPALRVAPGGPHGPRAA